MTQRRHPTRLLALLLALAGGCDSEPEPTEVDTGNTAPACEDHSGQEAMLAGDACGCTPATVCLSGVEGTALTPSPSCYFDTETNMVVSFANTFTVLPEGWQSCSDANAPEACGCCSAAGMCEAAD